MAYWLFKSEPDVFSIEDLYTSKKHTACWDGVRNYQARNFLRDDIKQADEVLFYHSSSKVIGIAGLACVVREGYADPTQFQEENPGYDPQSLPEKPRWYAVDLRHKQTFTSLLTLQRLRQETSLSELLLLKKGCRLSIQPVCQQHFHIIMKLAS